VRGERCATGRGNACGWGPISCAEREQIGGRETEDDAPRTRLEERPDGTGCFRVIALNVMRACALFAAPTSARPAVLIQKRSRTQKAGGKGRRGVQWLGGARAEQDGAGAASGMLMRGMRQFQVLALPENCFCLDAWTRMRQRRRTSGGRREEETRGCSTRVWSLFFPLRSLFSRAPLCSAA
jgi:hypothetical protein